MCSKGSANVEVITVCLHGLKGTTPDRKVGSMTANHLLSSQIVRC